MGDPIEFRILGRLDAAVGERPIGVRGRRTQLTLATLLLDAGRVVPVPRLMEAVWEHDPPASARTQIAMAVSNLRRALRQAGGPPDVIETSGPGYRMRVTGVRLDAWTAEERLLWARSAVADGRAEEAAVLYRDALRLWRGPVLDGLGGLDSTIVTAGARRWEDLRLVATEELADVQFALGRPAELIERLSGLLAQHPFRERLRAQLMTALARTGRQTDALDLYQDGRRLLARELGLEPGGDLREVHLAILRGDPSMHPAAPAPRPVRPAQLPAAVAAFAGRDAELRALDGLLAVQGLPVSVISGVAGAGKTALALHWAHRAADVFADGQLFADLRGNGTGPVSPGVVLERFLRALGVTGDRIPADPEERAALYRSVLRGRRALIVLDAAASADQVRPLLPGGAGCCVVVTARRRLAGLMVSHDARPVPLGALGAGEAVHLLRMTAGAARIDGDPAAARRLADLCERLPLALRIAGTRLAVQPTLTVAEVSALLAGREGAMGLGDDAELW
ncbi:AfsR/SARP family transcriptional regulator [Spongiactinospora sp. TRM90649]|uniref:AfsR/SARP family transcriptional regulator n=1 Tax=Spongiactinospora sp. TRM90649 TaxID=3031114 RepID=UPI0023F78AD3|nr:AfsR/SARP family transcriptional regulator [Spongiactinospora sp. TRM90649]MDF5756206.1 BTAD domain-containing putative transcriptional regulator [Spongiactinospora sp. TRM90649]